MPKFHVTVYVDKYEIISVEASNISEAKDKALVGDGRVIHSRDMQVSDVECELISEN